MIFTECPSCNEPITYSYEAGEEPVGAFAEVKCGKCHKNMFIERISFDGITYSEEAFWEKFSDGRKA